MTTLTLSITILIFAIAVSFLYGLVTRNYSTVDRLWSILPVVYLLCWLPDYIDNPRFIIAGVLVLAWAVRLTVNFAIKGGYAFSFPTGFTGEDYRWEILREKIGNRVLFELFNLLFISSYQLLLIFAFTLPLYFYGKVSGPITAVEILLYTVHALLLMLEAAADIQQLRFYRSRSTGGSRHSLGFNTFGLWQYSRHPNYVCEMGQWIVVYLYLVAATGMLHWSGIGAVLLVGLFAGSTRFTETVTASKYEQYGEWKEMTSVWVPVRRTWGQKNKREEFLSSL